MSRNFHKQTQAFRTPMFHRGFNLRSFTPLVVRCDLRSEILRCLTWSLDSVCFWLFTGWFMGISIQQHTKNMFSCRCSLQPIPWKSNRLEPFLGRTMPQNEDGVPEGLDPKWLGKWGLPSKWQFFRIENIIDDNPMLCWVHHFQISYHIDYLQYIYMMYIHIYIHINIDVYNCIYTYPIITPVYHHVCCLSPQYTTSNQLRSRRRQLIPKTLLPAVHQAADMACGRP